MYRVGLVLKQFAMMTILPVFIASFMNLYFVKIDKIENIIGGAISLLIALTFFVLILQCFEEVCFATVKLKVYSTKEIISK